MNENPPVKATATSARVIDALLDLEGATVTELTDYLSLSKSSVHNHLQTLVDLGYVERDEWEYNASLRFLEVGTTVRHRYRIYQAGADEVRALASAGFAANLVVVQDEAAVCIETATHSDRERIVEIGDRLPLHCSAGGKAMLAAMDHEERTAVLDDIPLEYHTESTLTDRSKLLSHLNEVRSRGLALNREEWRDGVRGIASAVSAPDDTLLGAVCVTGSDEHLSGKTLQQDASGLVLSSANRIRRRIRQE
ncbi:IclR family transcriptional regulator [Halobellus salinisoli]|uniref:IclR family transcriptional regulator n=1 Tax=Halobellus salinisoli TaxID=3108500 RepID=UPI0030094AF0